MTLDGGLLPTPAAGIHLSTEPFEAVIDGLRAALGGLAGTEVTQTLRTPPVIARTVIERVRYHESFPHLLGRIHTRTGVENSADSDLVLLPAACYCLYPMYEGVRLNAPVALSVDATCFRHEGSDETGRLRSFRMREFVRLGTAEECRDWRDNRLAETQKWLSEVGLATSRVVASDPFFSGGNRLIRMLQVEQELKIELVTALAPGQAQAVASGNYHKDQFGRSFGISDPAGGIAHTACMAFGYERLTLALLHRHGHDPRRWPEQVREALRLKDRV